MHDLLRRCTLAVLTTGSTSDDPRAAQELYPDFDIEVRQQDRGLRIDLKNAPAIAFVDGEIIRGVAELLAAVVRDLVYTAIELAPEYADELGTSAGVTDAVFRLLRNASVLQPADPNLVVCWGGHSINRDEYQYTKDVGYELGLRGLDICTGCGPRSEEHTPALQALMRKSSAVLCCDKTKEMYNTNPLSLKLVTTN